MDGEFAGGHDVIKEYYENGTIGELLNAETDKFAKCKKLVNSKPIMLFIKGTIDMPACGFTSKLLVLFRD